MSSVTAIDEARYSAHGEYRYSPAVPETPEQTDPPTRTRSGRAAVLYWFVAGAVYIALGVAYPPAFLLGFQESVLFVLIVTALAPKILGRIR
jgi:hypothetical protein